MFDCAGTSDDILRAPRPDDVSPWKPWIVAMSGWLQTRVVGEWGRLEESTGHSLWSSCNM